MDIFESVKRTIEYSRKHSGQLTEKQLFERLIGNRIYKKSEFKNIIKNHPPFGHPPLKKEGIYNDYLFKVKKAEELANKISKKFKNILFLGITGSVAAEYPKKNDDIDLIIITKADKLWLSRLKLRLFITINKIPHRRFGKKEKKDDFCFNLWLDEKSLRLRKEKQKLKNAVDLILVKPLINRNNTYEKFILVNSWAKKYVATGYGNKIKDLRFKKYDLRTKKNLIDKMINWVVFWPQFLYMKRRMKNEKVGLHEAFFHH